MLGCTFVTTFCQVHRGGTSSILVIPLTSTFSECSSSSSMGQVQSDGEENELLHVRLSARGC